MLLALIAAMDCNAFESIGFTGATILTPLIENPDGGNLSAEDVLSELKHPETFINKHVMIESLTM